jgi:hypothetical protein
MTELHITNRMWEAPREVSHREESIKIEFTCGHEQFTRILTPTVKAFAESRKTGEITLVFTNTAATAIRHAKTAAIILDDMRYQDCKNPEPQEAWRMTGNDSNKVQIFKMRMVKGKFPESELTGRCSVFALDSSVGKVNSDFFVAALRNGMPQYLSVISQEMGSLDRGVGIGEKRSYHVVLCVKSYCHARARNSKNSSQTVVDFPDQRLKETLRFLFLGNECWHLKLSKAFDDPSSTSYGPETCDGMCPVCSKEISNLKLPINLKNLRRAIIRIFAGKIWVGLVKEMGNLLLKEHKTNQIWTRNKPSRDHVNFLLLQLVAAALLETGVVDKSRDRDGDDNSADEVFVKLAYERGDDTMRSVDVAKNWNDLFLL